MRDARVLKVTCDSQRVMDVTARYDPRMHAHEEQTRFSGVIYVLMLVVALAFGGFVWQLYSEPEVPHIAAEPGPYKTEPPPEATAEANVEAAPLTGSESTPNDTGNTANAEVATIAGGAFVAQLAALQSQAAVEPAWRRFAARAPDLFADARLDVERADLGARGVYYRVRAGYFASRADAAQFCGRIRQMGQDCIPAAR